MDSSTFTQSGRNIKISLNINFQLPDLDSTVQNQVNIPLIDVQTPTNITYGNVSMSISHLSNMKSTNDDDTNHHRCCDSSVQINIPSIPLSENMHAPIVPLGENTDETAARVDIHEPVNNNTQSLPVSPSMDFNAETGNNQDNMDPAPCMAIIDCSGQQQCLPCDIQPIAIALPWIESGRRATNFITDSPSGLGEKRTRGRPKKVQIIEVAPAAGEKRARGRPKKVQIVEVSSEAVAKRPVSRPKRLGKKEDIRDPVVKRKAGRRKRKIVEDVDAASENVVKRKVGRPKKKIAEEDMAESSGGGKMRGRPAGRKSTAKNTQTLCTTTDWIRTRGDKGRLCTKLRLENKMKSRTPISVEDRENAIPID